ncbi:MAG: leucine-rich repeat domain-containing protein, partial [Planctomycetota bacterium]
KADKSGSDANDLSEVETETQSESSGISASQLLAKYRAMRDILWTYSAEGQRLIEEHDRKEKTTSKPGLDSVRASYRVHFPSDRSLGKLYIQDAGIVRQIKTFHHWIDGADWGNYAEYLCEAQGDVTIPAGKRLALFVNRAAWRDLSPLSKLRPDDLYMLTLPNFMPESVKPDDRCMPHIAGLTGLKVLGLKWTNISSRGLRYIKDFKKLERLNLPDGTTDAGLADIAELHSLKGLYFQGRNQVTNAGLRHLAKLTSLEELALVSEQVDDAGLVYLAKLPKLRYLQLLGNSIFSDAGMVHLKDIPNLRILDISVLRQITDEGLANLAGCTQLERINFHWNKNITDKGVSYLATMPSLKMIDLRHAHITDAGLAHLAEIKSLEYLDLPSESVTDKGLGYLGQLTNLKHLRMPSPHYVDPKRDKRLYTDKGLEELTKLQSLEELSLSGLGVTDAGMSHIAKLSNLRNLNISGCLITNKGLAKLTTLKSLKSLWLYETKVTISGLSQFNVLPNLVKLEARHIKQDNLGLDISALTRLERLIIEAHRKKGGIRDEDLACLSKHKRLKLCHLWHTKLTDAGMAHLAGLTNLDWLGISGANLTDDGLKYLTNMRRLNNLSITGNGNFTDNGLRYLEGLKALGSLKITSKNNFSRAALVRLRKNLPNLHTFQVKKAKESK